VKTVNAPAPRRNSERGASIFIVAAAMVALLGLAGLAIDLVALYLGRSEAQRASDAAALAGAQTFVTSGFTSGLVSQATVQTLATNEAVAVGQQNFVGGQAPTIPNGNVTFDFSHAGDPVITVVVTASLPTNFMQIFGVSSVNVSATAKAEAYNPSGSSSGSQTICASCLKPFLVPNCDPNTAYKTPASPVCTGQSVFFNTDGTLAHAGLYPNGPIGETWFLHSNGSVPSHWYEIAFSGQSGSKFASNVSSCSTVELTCGSQLTVLDGKKVGPTDSGINDLIHASSDGAGNGQDSIVFASNPPAGTLPYTITGGSNNPNSALVGKTVTQSDSIVTVPVYDPATMGGPGNGDVVTVVGYMQMFIEYANHSGNDDQINALILNISSCGQSGGSCGSGGSGQGSSGTLSGGGSQFIPVRLVQ